MLINPHNIDGMNIETIMSADVITVKVDDDLYRVREIFNTRKFHHLVVMQSGELKGVISDRDLLKALSPSLETEEETLKDRSILAKKVSEIMTKEVVAVTRDVSIKAAAQLMLSKNVSCLPIANEKKRVIGIVTLKDVLWSYIDPGKVKKKTEQ
ncbi:CBS domain-containing protein [Fibrobacterota bacterium]